MARRMALLLCLVLAASAEAAPAPLPRRDRETAAQARDRTLNGCRRRLEGLGVTWKVIDRNGARVLRYSVSHPRGGGMGGGYVLENDAQLLPLLQHVIRRVESYLRDPDRF